MALPPVPKALEVHPKLQEALLIAWLYDAGMLGFKESRDLLQHVVTNFDNVRDTELDDYVTTVEQSGVEDDDQSEEIPDLPDE